MVVVPAAINMAASVMSVALGIEYIVVFLRFEVVGSSFFQARKVVRGRGDEGPGFHIVP